MKAWSVGICGVTDFALSEPPQPNEQPIAFAVPADADVPSVTMPVEIVSVHDGDSVRVKASIEFPVRLLNCWAPELKAPGGVASRDNLRALLPIGSTQLVTIPVRDDMSQMLSLDRVLGDIITSEGRASELQVNSKFAERTKPKAK